MVGHRSMQVAIPTPIPLPCCEGEKDPRGHTEGYDHCYTNQWKEQKAGNSKLCLLRASAPQGAPETLSAPRGPQH